MQIDSRNIIYIVKSVRLIKKIDTLQ